MYLITVGCMTIIITNYNLFADLYAIIIGIFWVIVGIIFKSLFIKIGKLLELWSIKEKNSSFFKNIKIFCKKTFKKLF